MFFALAYIHVRIHVDLATFSLHPPFHLTNPRVDTSQPVLQPGVPPGLRGVAPASTFPGVRIARSQVSRGYFRAPFST